MKTVRAKFKCRAVTKEGENNRVVLGAVTDGSEENDSFFQYTPGGEIDLQVISGDTASRFEEGKEYYVDFSPAD